MSGFTDMNKLMPDFYSIRELAGKKLADMLQEKHELPLEESSRKLQLIRLSLGDLTRAFDDDAEDISIRTHAAIIMEGLCIDFGKEVNGILASVIPKVN